MPIFGWDASDFDWDRGPMDLGAAVRDGISFFTHKATEGTRVKHVHYRAALERARDAGMQRYGAYIVVRTPGNGGHGSVDAQVRYFLAYLDSETPWWRDDPRFKIGQVDTEHWGYDNVAPRYGAEACALLRRYAPKLWVPHYAPAWAYTDTIPGDDPLWASSYGTNRAAPYRQLYPGDASIAWGRYSRRTPAIVQFGSRAQVGRQPSCDINAIRDPAVWAALTGGDEMSAKASEIIERWSVGVGKTADGQEITPVVWRVRDEAWQVEVTARLAADEVRDKALTVTVEGLVAAINGAGGSVDAAPIIAKIQEVRDEAREQFAALRAENADLQVKLAAAEARIADAAQAEADALKPDAS